jgi:hypothetical protein
MCPAGYPKNTRLACTPGTSETNPFHSCHGFQVPVQTWTLSPHAWGPASMRCLDLHLSPPPISRSRKSQSPWQESNKPSRSHKHVCARDNKSVTWLGSMQWTVLNWRGQGKQCNQAMPCGCGTPPVTPTNTHTISLLDHHFFSPFYCEMIIIITYCE